MDYMAAPRVEFCEPQCENIVFFDAWETPQGDIESRRGRLHTKDVESWLALDHCIVDDDGATADIDPQRVRLRVMCSIHPRKEKFQFGLTRTSYHLVAERFELHPLTYPFLVGTDGVFACYFDETSTEEQCLKRLKLVCKTPSAKAIAVDGISMCYDPASRCTRTLLHGIYQDDWDRIVGYLRSRSRSGLIAHPLAVPVLLHANRLHNVEMYRREVDKYIFDTEKEIGVASPSVLEKTDDQPPSPPLPNRASFSSKSGLFVKRLHSYLTALAILGNVMRVNEGYGSSLRDTFQRLDDLQLQLDQEVSQELRHRLDISNHSSDCIVSHIQALRDRAQIQTNLVFSLISQEENRISRSVAEDSTAVAVAAKRDSSAMKTIAVLTVIFLPVTFVATMFGTPFFSWDGQVGSRVVVSDDIWIYWAVSLPLTAVVLALWRIWWTLEDRRHDRNLEQARMEKIKQLGDFR